MANQSCFGRGSRRRCLHSFLEVKTMSRANDGNFETTYTKVVGITGGMGFSGGGPLPRALLLAESSIRVTFNDIHGNQVVIGHSAAAGKPTLLEGLQVSDVILVQDGSDTAGKNAAAVLW
mgnify:CR=1 FL=1